MTLQGIERRKVLDALDKANIEWRPMLAGNIARQPAFKNSIKVYDKLTNADRLLNNSFWVSVHPLHTPEVMEYVANTIVKSLK